MKKNKYKIEKRLYGYFACETYYVLHLHKQSQTFYVDTLYSFKYE